MRIHPSPCHYSGKIGIVGTGMVGATFAYAVLQSGIASEMVLIDANRDRAYGEALDLNHGLPFVKPMNIHAGDYEDLCCAEVVVVTAGLTQAGPYQTRLELLDRNVRVIEDVIPRIVEVNPHGVIVIASNPVDVLTQVAWEISELPKGRVIGSGTVLDSARFRTLIAQYFSVDPRNVHAYVIGEHGDSELPVWSLANIAGVRLADYVSPIGKRINHDEMKRIFEKTRCAAAEVIKCKKATYYAIGLSLLSIVQAIIRDQDTVLTVSSPITNKYGISDVSISLPAVVGAEGVQAILDLPLSKPEEEAFQHSAAVLKKARLDLAEAQTERKRIENEHQAFSA